MPNPNFPFARAASAAGRARAETDSDGCRSRAGGTASEGVPPAGRCAADWSGVGCAIGATAGAEVTALCEGMWRRIRGFSADDGWPAPALTAVSWAFTDCWMIALLAAVPSAPQGGQRTGPGMRLLMGSTSNL